MGCSNQKIKMVPPNTVSLDGVDLDTYYTRISNENPFFKERLREIDWNFFIKSNQ